MVAATRVKSREKETLERGRKSDYDVVRRGKSRYRGRVGQGKSTVATVAGGEGGRELQIREETPVSSRAGGNAGREGGEIRPSTGVAERNARRQGNVKGLSL